MEKKEQNQTNDLGIKTAFRVHIQHPFGAHFLQVWVSSSVQHLARGSGAASGQG